MNELIFFLHVVSLVFFLWIAGRFQEKGLIVCVALQAVLANVFVSQQMVFAGLTVTCSDPFSVGSILGLNLLQERFGRESAKSAIRLSFFSLFFFVAMAHLHLLYRPLPEDPVAGAFSEIFSASWRIFLSSAAVFYLVQRADVLLYGWLQKRLGPSARLFLSLFISQTLDTVLFSFLGLYGMVEEIGHVILMSLSVKLAAAAISWGAVPLFFRRPRVSL